MVILLAATGYRKARLGSDVASHVFTALSRHHDLSTVDTSLGRLERSVARLVAVAPGRSRWRRRSERGALATALRTSKLEATIRSTPDARAVLAVRSSYNPLSLPYVPYLDSALPLIQSIGADARWHSFGLKTAMKIEREYLRGAAHIFVVGRQLEDAICSEYSIPSARVTVVGGGANFATEPHDYTTRAAEILFIGHDFARKGGPDLLEALPQVRRALPDATLTIVGPSLTSLPAGAVCLGPVTDREVVRERLRAASVLVLPSRWEPYGMVLLEAMAMSLPCVSTTVNAIPDIVVDGETGILVPPRQPDRLAGALIRILSDPSLAKRMGEAGRLRVERQMRWEHVIERMRPVLDDLNR